MSAFENLSVEDKLSYLFEEVRRLKEYHTEQEPPTEVGPYNWVNAVYGAPFPYPVVENPHGDKLAVWRVIEEASVFTPACYNEGKPVFTTNTGTKLQPGAEVFGYRKVMSGLECDGEPHIVVCDPDGGAMMKRKVELVGEITEDGYLAND